jgi:isopentenyl-diphosphate delta-isomerase type 1
VEPEDEILEVVDAQGRVLGRATRGECHSDKSLLHRAVHVFVLDRQGRIFLQKRSMLKRIQPGRWDASVGGHVDPGETPEQAAVREMDEELGVSGVELELLHEYVWRSPVESELVRTFRCSCEGPFRLKADEIDEGRFFSLDELRALVGTGQLTPNLEHELLLLGIVEPAE